MCSELVFRIMAGMWLRMLLVFRTSANMKMESFEKLSTIFAKLPILDVCGSPGSASGTLTRI